MGVMRLAMMGDMRPGRVMDRVRARLREIGVDADVIDVRWEDESVQQLDILVAIPPAYVTSELIGAASLLKAVVSPISGTDHINVDVASRFGVAVVGNHVEEVTSAQAEATLLLFLAARFQLLERTESLRADWQPTSLAPGPLRGSTIGLVGFGRIARAVMAKLAVFDVSVIVSSNRRIVDLPGYAQQRPLNELLGSSDIVSLHGRPTDKATVLIGEAELGLMKEGAVLVNTARGELVNQAAALRAAARRRIVLAFDVFDEEPLSRENPIRSAPAAILTPHCIGHTEETTEALAESCLRSIAVLQQHRLPMTQLVNGEVIGRWRGRDQEGWDHD